MKSCRPSTVIAEQIADFEATLPKERVQVPDDFAAELQQSSWQNHLAELRTELEESKRREAFAWEAKLIEAAKSMEFGQEKLASAGRANAYQKDTSMPHVLLFEDKGQEQDGYVKNLTQAVQSLEGDSIEGRKIQALEAAWVSDPPLDTQALLHQSGCFRIRVYSFDPVQP